MTGARACDTHLYKRDAYPIDLIAPAKILWRPVGPSPASDSGHDQDANSTKQKSKGKGKATADPNTDQQRTVWIWVHPSVYNNVIAELRICISLVLEAVRKGDPSADTLDVELADLRREVNVFEIMGPKASQVIRGALKPIGQDGREDFRKVSAVVLLHSSALTLRGLVLVLSCGFTVGGFSPKKYCDRVQSP